MRLARRNQLPDKLNRRGEGHGGVRLYSATFGRTQAKTCLGGPRAASSVIPATRCRIPDSAARLSRPCHGSWYERVTNDPDWLVRNGTLPLSAAGRPWLLFELSRAS